MTKASLLPVPENSVNQSKQTDLFRTVICIVDLAFEKFYTERLVCC